MVAGLLTEIFIFETWSSVSPGITDDNYDWILTWSLPCVAI